MINKSVHNAWTLDHRYALLNEKVPAAEDVPHIHKLLFPVYAVGLFGLVSAFIVLYRVMTFNNCDEAAVELKAEINEAKEFLKKHGITVGAK